MGATEPDNLFYTNFSLDPARPLADQIVSNTIQTIDQQSLPHGTRLPSIRQVANALGVNRNTVAHAYRELAEKGYVATHFGGGSYVANPRLRYGSTFRPQVETNSDAVASPPELTEGDLDLRFSNRMSVLAGSSSKTQLTGAMDGSSINLFHLRPNTGVFPLEKFRKCINTVLRRHGQRLLNYGTPAGYMPLREQIAGRLRAGGIPADPANILITSGSQQGIDILAQAFINPGDAVVVESPTYTNAIRIFTGHGARLMPFAIESDGISMETLERFQFQSAPKLFYAVPYFQNPTTHSYSPEEKQALLRQVYRSGSLVVEDAYYSEMHPNPSPALAAMDNTGRVVHLNTFSKTMVPAVRVGYVLAPPVLVRRLTELKETTDLSHSLILQAAIAEFMERGYFDAHLTQVREFYQERLEMVSALVTRYLPTDTQYNPPPGGLFIWLDLPVGIDTERLAIQLQNDGVLVCPAPLFQPAAGGRNGLRLSVAFENVERLERAFRVLGKRLRELPKQPTQDHWNTEYQGTH